jgi:hypothetical protein
LDKSDSYGHTMGTMVILAIPLNFWYFNSIVFGFLHN